MSWIWDIFTQVASSYLLPIMVFLPKFKLCLYVDTYILDTNTHTYIFINVMYFVRTHMFKLQQRLSGVETPMGEYKVKI